MYRSVFLSLLLSLCLAAVAGAAPEGIPIQYMDSHDRMPAMSAGRFMERRQTEPYNATVGISASADDGKVILIVEQRIYTGIQSSLATFTADLEGEGYTVELWQISGGNAADIRSDLQTAYLAGGLDGAICIGDIPTGWLDNGFGEYPVDLFLMDMNGTWNDPDGDGVYESYSSGAPEIWVGRLTPTFLSHGSSVELLNNYFSKNHAYRSGTLSLPDRALAYEEAFTGLTYYLDNLYTVVVRVNDPVGTNADDFKEELLNGYEWVHLISHSSPWGSSFHTGAPPEGAGTFDSFEVPPLNPHAFFYVLNCCSNGRWTEIDNLANSYIWCDTYGLASLAQTKVDYTNDFQEYYLALAGGSNLGDAFRTWLAANMYNEDGAVLFGDPTLVPRQSGTTAGVAGGQSGQGSGSDSWSECAITEGFHSQGRVDTWTDPVTGSVFAVSGTSDPVRANIMATHSIGDIWSSPVIVCQHVYWDWHPAVGGDGTGNVWTAWQSMHENHEGYDIFISSWNGTTWLPETQLTTGDPFEVDPGMAGGNGHAWLVWQKWDGGETDIEGILWTGTQWTEIETVAGESGSERHPDVAWGAEGFGLVYQALRSDQWAICFRDAPDSGPFGSEEVISLPSEESRYACLTAAPDGTFWVAWQCAGGGVKSSHQIGSGWSVPELISGPDYGIRPSLTAASDGSVTVAWVANGNSLHINTYSGTSWSGIIPAVSADAIDDVSLAYAGDGKLWAVYGRRDTDLQWDLWAATGNPTGVEEGSGDVCGPGLSIAGSNPFQSSIALEINVSGDASLEVFDLSGRVVRKETVTSGVFLWNGTDQSDRFLPAGVYILRLSDGVNSFGCRVVKVSF